MEIYKGASAFAGIAIGKIRFYRKGEYQIRQHQADDVKKELKNFDVARRHVMQTLKEEYDRMSEKQMDTADPELDMEPQPLDRIVKVNGENGTNQILEQAEYFFQAERSDHKGTNPQCKPHLQSPSGDSRGR